MVEYIDKFTEESNYLEEITYLLNSLLEYEKGNLEDQKSDLVAARREMWENTTHSSADFDKLSDLNQYLSALQTQTYSYAELAKRILKYEKMLESPYFARVDFTEDGYDDLEKIYIGHYNLMNEDTGEIKVYDWRAPISSIFYRNEPGHVEYKAPAGLIKGIMSLKRQFKIKNGKMEYFFDSSMNIADEMLREALSKNMTSKMKTIVETIQRQQDLIIRDLDNELLIVQGVAGSGKTSVALHRIAFLMYQGLNLKISSNNIVIISPNSLFSKYISNVLPELGEENIQELTFENIFLKMFDNKLSVKTKSEQFEDMICAESNEKRSFLRQVAEFKGSDEFMEIMRRFVKYFERKLIPFEDVYFNGKYIESRQLLKALLLSNKLNMPTAKKLKIIENRLMEQVHQLKLERRKKIEEVVNESNNHEFEIKSFTRVLAAKETAAFTKALHKFTEFDVYELYKNLFSDKNLFYKISKGLKLPSNIEEMIDFTTKNIEDRFNIQYADGIGLMYLKIIAEGCDFYYDMKQVIIDEAQDYYPVHYNIIKEIFREARFTVVGDVNQAAEKQADLSIYDKITSIFGKRKNSKVFLTKSYRSSYEISKFSKNLLDTGIDTEFFRRSEETPKIKSAASIGELEDMMLKDISSYKSQGFESIAILCKSRKQAVELYMRLSGKTDLKLIDYVGNESISGVTVVPVYMAKGLEFDAVMVYNTDDENYRDSFDKRLLYIACTRALHRLSMYYTGNITCFLK